ncbi:hypothetical protein ABEX47_03245 [Paenibacillus ehimensis]|uniref:hypothetical protein n=1 Tax=Paenibacillus ehimensis TaxID=79264 RepID=UPI003D27B250
MSHYFYVTPEEYKQAEALGIKPAMLDRRIREQGWPKAKAMSTPPRKLTDRSKWRKVAEQNGISYDSFMSRINRGWTEERAAKEPLQTPEQVREQALRATEYVRVIPREYLELADRNGIPRATVHQRIKEQKLSMLDAVTRPIMRREECGRRGARALREREGDWAAQIFGKRPKTKKG